MAWRRALILACCVVFGSPSDIVAQEHFAFWSFLDGRSVSRCAEKSPQHDAASKALEQLYEQFERLNPSDNPAAATEALYALLKSECFHLASEIQELPKPDSVASLRDWRDRGAFDWLASYLEVPQLGELSNLQPHILLPPDPRSTLSLDKNRDHDLAAFLCPSADSTCGSGTRGWRARAEAFFRGPLKGDFDAEERLSARCVSEAANEPPEYRYAYWVGCVQGFGEKTAALPLGDFKAPNNGWLIISGRRGHYEFCDGTSAYHLASGAAFQFESCSALSLLQDGSVDREATNKARVKRIRAGRVSVENLREAAWMLLLAPHSRSIRLGVQHFPLPPGMQQTIVAGASPMFGEVMIWNSGMTRLSWRLVGAAERSYSGEVTWPRAYQGADDHAADLIGVFEAGLMEGCAPQAPLAVARVEAAGRGELAEDYRAAYAEWRKIQTCRAERR